ncbi:MAG: nucleotidyltransferase domain-containing protein [Chitinophagaceae bacterium]|nr:nucleotidyltransferase domain-containing protein [Chitinophagaceae bacterium]
MLIRDKDKETLQRLFSSVEIPIEVWAYGSRVDGTAHEGSDLDLVIRSKNLEKIPLDIYLTIKENIQKSNIPFLVDLFDWARLPVNFHHNIEQKHEVLFSNIQP